MNNEEVTKILIDLCQLDIDATAAYEEALKNIDDDSIYSQIDEFKNDHIRHVNNLSAMIREYGEEPPEQTPDLKGYLIEGYTALRSVTGLEGALNAMETNEVITNRQYRLALENNPDLPPDVKAILTGNFNDEKRHLEFIRQTLKTLEHFPS